MIRRSCCFSLNYFSQKKKFMNRKRSLETLAKPALLESDDAEDYDFTEINDEESDGSDVADGTTAGEDEDDNDEDEDDSFDDEDDSFDNEDDDQDDGFGDELDSDKEYQEIEKEMNSKNLFRALRRADKTEIDPFYDSDSSDEETHNTVGNIPMEWYDDFPHIGYDINGKKIMRPAQGDELDAFLSAMDDKDFWRSVHDKMEGKDVKLTSEELGLLKKIHNHEFPDSQFDPYAPTIEWFTSKVEVMPLSAAPEPKRRFIPSKIEASKIMKIARAIKAGLIVPGKSNKPKASDKPKFYDIWESAPNEIHRPNHIAASKMTLPEHMESYNPPAEYLYSPEEEKKWKETDAEDRQKNFIPQKFNSMRRIPAYERFIQERFSRCLDLYLCPRTIKNKLNIDPESLIPKLPKPQDLQPFPSKLSIEYKGHSARVRSLSVDPSGQWLATGSDDKTVCIWEISSGRCVEKFVLKHSIMNVSWNPNKNASLLAVVFDNQVMLIVPTKINHNLQEATLELLSDILSQAGNPTGSCEWSRPNEEEQLLGFRVRIALAKGITSLSWHRKGDYFATVSPDAATSAVQIHQISAGRSQTPFRKSKGLVQQVLFHPLKPIIFVATQRYVRVYNLVKQELVKKLMSGSQWISSMDIHPGGDNLIVGTYDKRLHWFDMDLSARPYKTLRFHKEAVRQVAYHKRYPLFASSSDDGTVIVFHGMVYNDLMQNPLIVPVKSLKAHQPVSHLGALQCQFHPTQPWLFTSGADGNVKLFC
ncbi:Ribosome biogenesis protein erb1 [Batrachochytrium dendrobatidis]